MFEQFKKDLATVADQHVDGDYIHSLLEFADTKEFLSEIKSVESYVGNDSLLAAFIKQHPFHDELVMQQVENDIEIGYKPEIKPNNVITIEQHKAEMKGLLLHLANCIGVADAVLQMTLCFEAGRVCYLSDKHSLVETARHLDNYGRAALRNIYLKYKELQE